MKIYKKNEQSLLVKTFGFNNQLFLATTVLIFFDLNDPDSPLTEQDLWKAVPDELGPGQVLDMGMPKPRGEVLLTGKCYAPRGQSRSAGKVFMRVGPLNKELTIFGPRQWQGIAETMRRITPAEPFTEMPITYENAFGGPGYEKNPKGKGLKPITTADGRAIHPLPNIEYSDRLLGSPTDTPDPAGFGPLDVLWPPRSKKTGTYDDKWLQTHWPYFPDDLNFEFFNTAPEDQFITGFFQGGEPIELINLHPDLQAINSHVPRLRVRCFITKRKDLKKNRDEEIFQEATTQIDTVWLFPSILRGVAMFRGVSQVLDDEFADIVRIFLATESLSEPSKSIDFYYEAQQKALDLTVPIDQAPLEKAQKKIGEAMKRFRMVPKEIEAIKQKFMGRAPRMPAPTPAEMNAKAKALIAEHMVTLDKLEAQAKAMHAQHGHLVRVPLEKFDQMRAKLENMGTKIDQAVGKLEQTQAKAAEAQKGVSDQIKARVSPENLQKSGVDPDNLIPARKVNPWHDRGFPFIVQCRKNLEASPEMLQVLRSLGLNNRTIKRAWLGTNPEEIRDEAKMWGLKPETDGQGRPLPLIIPAGLTIPGFDGAVLDSIQIRHKDMGDPWHDIWIKGSNQTPLFLSAMTEGAPVVRVRGELEALLLEQEVGDVVHVIALRDAAVKPGEAAAKAIETASTFQIITYGKPWTPWEKAYPQATRLPLPVGKNIFEVRAQGIDLRQWILSVLPPEISRGAQVEPALPEAGKPPSGSPLAGLAFPQLDIKSLVNAAIDEIKAFYDKKYAFVAEEKAKIEAKAREAIVKAGRDPEPIMAASKKITAPSLAEAKETITGKLVNQRESLRALGHLTPEREAQFNDALKQVDQLTARGQAQLAALAEQKQKLAEGKAKLAARELPPEAKEKFLSYGIDPDKIKKRTRDEVIAMHADGLSLSGAILSGLDLSGLDLAGIDLKQAQCNKTNFSGASLAGADLSQAQAREADFSQADLTSANMEKGLFLKAKLNGANLTQANLHQAILKEAELVEAVLTGARLDWTILQKAKLTKAKLDKIQAEMAVFSGAQIDGVDFRQARLIKCLFKDNQLDGSFFEGAVFNSTMLMGVSGEKVSFANANLDRVRITGQAKLAGADFRNSTLVEACFRDSNLSGANFQDSILDQALIENCDLTRANLVRTSAKKARLTKSNLEGARLIAVNLFMGSLRKSRLVETDLSLSNLYAVDFFKAVLGRTNFSQTNLKMTQLHNRTELLE